MNKKILRKGLSLLCTLLIVQLTFAQEKIITGTVVDENDSPLPGVTITTSSSGGTSTDFDGEFSINARVGEEIEFTYMGYSKQVISVTDSQEEYKIQMKPSKNIMDEVIVTAYGVAEKESVTGSITNITSEDIEKRPVTNVFQALEGSAPGIQFNSNSGRPGSAGSIRIRGFSTLNGSNSPLYVIDGVPFGGDISDLNPHDIDEISVLKDASATALYGNRASNGVIIIKTKGGAGKPGSSLNVSIKQGIFERGLPEYNRIGPDRFMEMMWRGYRNSLLTEKADMSRVDANQRASNTLVEDYLKTNIYNVDDDQLFTENGKLNPDAQILAGYLNDFDWRGPLERKGYRQEYNISGRNSSEKGGAYYSIGYLNEEGYVKTSDFDRLTGRLNAEHNFTDWLKFGTNLSGSIQKKNNVNSSSSGSYKNPFMYSRKIAPIYPVHEHDPETGEYILDDNGEKIYDSGDNTRNQYVGRHVIWENELDTKNTHRNTLEGQAFIDINFLEDFTFSIKGDVNVRHAEEQKYNNAIIGDGAGNDGRSKKVIYRYKNYTGQQLLNWRRSFGEHNLEVLLGHENYYAMYDYTYGYKTNETFPNKGDLVNFNEITKLDGYKKDYATEGYFSRVKYNFDKKYYLEGSFRRDGSSKFKSGNRWGNFWSIGGSWIISKEDFIDYHWLNNLKLRASYGEVGNDTGASRYAYQALYYIDQNANMAALYKNQNSAEDLIWETSAQFDVGLEGRLFNRLNFTLDYFDKRSKNLLFDIDLPLSAGATHTGSASASQTKNLGTISNTGIEVAFDLDIIQTRDWNWNVGANATWLNNKIVTLPEENRENGIISGTKKRVEGRSIYDFWTYKFAGVDQMTGNSLYLPDKEGYNVNGSNPDKESLPADKLVEINGEYYTTKTTYAKKDWSGSAIPDVFGSFSTNLSWKNLSLRALVTYSYGGKVYEHSYKSLMSQSGTPGAMHENILEAWNGVPEGMNETSANRIDPSGVPAVDFSRSSDNNHTSDRWIKDGSYLVIKNVTLNYSLPEHLTQKLHLKSLDFNLGVENLKTFTKLKGMNPQYSYSGSSKDKFVPFRVYTLGINIGI